MTENTTIQEILGWVPGLGTCLVFLIENGPVKVNITVIFFIITPTRLKNYISGIPDFVIDQVIITVNICLYIFCYKNQITLSFIPQHREFSFYMSKSITVKYKPFALHSAC